MIRLQGKLPKELYIGVSGGIDSMAALDFLRRAHKVTVLIFDHGTEYHKLAEPVVLKYCSDHNLNVITGKIQDVIKPNNVSEEEHWRNERYRFFHSFDKEVITVHHLIDVLETWLWSSCHGEGKLIPYSYHNVIRPFRLNTKLDLINWIKNHNVPYVDDPSNFDTKHMRNYIRRHMVDNALHVNPGIYKVLRKKLMADYQNYTCKNNVNSIL